MPTYSEYQSKPRRVWASEPVTRKNREAVATWVRTWGGRVSIGREGRMLVLHSDLGGDLPVYEGWRVTYNGNDFAQVPPGTFDMLWSPVAGDASAGDPGLGGKPTSRA